MEGLVEGRIVHFVLDKTETINEGLDNGTEGKIENVICRPAIIVNAWGGKLEDGMVNLQVFLDGDNDNRYIEHLHNPSTLATKNDIIFGAVFQMWLTSIKYSENKEVGTWHWPERN